MYYIGVAYGVNPYMINIYIYCHSSKDELRVCSYWREEEPVCQFQTPVGETTKKGGKHRLLCADQWRKAYRATHLPQLLS